MKRRSFYAIEATGTGLIKLGIATNPAARLRELQCHSPVPLRLRFKFATFEDVRRLERRVHVALADKRRHGEWFATTLAEVKKAFQTAWENRTQ